MFPDRKVITHAVVRTADCCLLALLACVRSSMCTRTCNSPLQVVECVSDDGLRFFANYDKLAICTGSQVRPGLTSWVVIFWRHALAQGPSLERRV